MKLDSEDREQIQRLFHDFELVLGPVGAAKALHLLAPQLFPFWDRAIAQSYKLPLHNTGKNAERYWKFLLKVQRQCLALQKQSVKETTGLLKKLDEYITILDTQDTGYRKIGRMYECAQPEIGILKKSAGVRS